MNESSQVSWPQLTHAPPAPESVGAGAGAIMTEGTEGMEGVGAIITGVGAIITEGADPIINGGAEETE